MILKRFGLRHRSFQRILRLLHQMIGLQLRRGLLARKELRLQLRVLLVAYQQQRRIPKIDKKKISFHSIIDKTL